MTKQTYKPHDLATEVEELGSIPAGDVAMFQGQPLTRREWRMIRRVWWDALNWVGTLDSRSVEFDHAAVIGGGEFEFERRYGAPPAGTVPTAEPWEARLGDIEVLHDRLRARPSEQFREFADDVIPDELAHDRSMFDVRRAPRRWLAEIIAVSKRQEELFEEWHGFREYNLRVVQRLQLAIGERVIAERGIPSPDTRGSAR